MNASKFETDEKKKKTSSNPMKEILKGKQPLELEGGSIQACEMTLLSYTIRVSFSPHVGQYVAFAKLGSTW